MDKVDNDITQKPWPPDSVLLMVGMTREEWNQMAEAITRENLPWNWLVESAAKRIIRRRQDDLARVEREA